MSVFYNHLVISIISTFKEWDFLILRKINLSRFTWLDTFFNGITGSAFILAIGIPIFLFVLGYVSKNHISFRNTSLYIGSSVIISAIIAEILKYSVNRTRPFITHPVLENITIVQTPSFPSGHTVIAFALSVSLCIAFNKKYVWIISLLWAFTVLYSRLHLGVHYPSDVLGGMIIGAGFAFLYYKSQQWFIKKRKN